MMEKYYNIILFYKHLKLVESGHLGLTGTTTKSSVILCSALKKIFKLVDQKKKVATCYWPSAGNSCKISDDTQCFGSFSAL